MQSLRGALSLCQWALPVCPSPAVSWTKTPDAATSSLWPPTSPAASTRRVTTLCWSQVPPLLNYWNWDILPKCWFCFFFWTLSHHQVVGSSRSRSSITFRIFRSFIECSRTMAFRKITSRPSSVTDSFLVWWWRTMKLKLSVFRN